MFPYEQKHCNTRRVIQLLWWCLEIQITLNWDSCFTIYCTQNYFPYLVFLYTAAKTPDLDICPHYLVCLNFHFLLVFPFEFSQRFTGVSVFPQESIETIDSYIKFAHDWAYYHSILDDKVKWGPTFPKGGQLMLDVWGRVVFFPGAGTGKLPLL